MQISTREQEIYQNLMALCNAPGDAVFYFQDFPIGNGDTVMRVFNYRLASYTDFMRPDAMEARGIMFEVDDVHGTALRLACRPPKKFFNYRENPETIFDYDVLPAVSFAMIKEDGSLISSYTLRDEVGETLGLKSRGSINSQQSNAAEAWLYDQSRAALYNEVLGLDDAGWTVTFEWVSPDNRIVLPYFESKLVVLNIRNRETGYIMPLEIIKECYPEIWANFVQVNPESWTSIVEGSANFEEVVEKARAQTGIEGYVVYTPNAMFKMKNDWYVSLHHTKDSVTNPRRLFECVIDDATDDLRQMFATDPLALKLIEDAENKYIPMYNGLIAKCEAFVAENSNKERKDFALTAQAAFKDEKLPYFSCSMTMYGGKTPDWKAVFKKQYKILGIKDEKVEVDE